MRVVTLAGSPRFPSRSAAWLTLCQQALASGANAAPMLAVDKALLSARLAEAIDTPYGMPLRAAVSHSLPPYNQGS